MLLNIETMGCGRSKHHSPKLGCEEVEVYVSASDKNVGKKKKSKDEKKENTDPGSTSPKVSKSSPIKMAGNFLKPPPAQEHNSPTKKDTREFSGKQTNIKITNSQIEFFKMLDEKIEQGDDYKSHDSINLLTP